MNAAPLTIRHLAYAAVVLAALASAACRGAHERPSDTTTATLPATIAVAAEEPAGAIVMATATIEPLRRASPGTLLFGRVERVLRREGDAVRAGDTLALIDGRDAAARQVQAEAAVVAARAAEANARAMRERMERLVAREAASRKMLEDATLGHDTALAQVRAAEEGLVSAKVFSGHARVTSPFEGVVTRRNVEEGDLAAPGQPLFVIEDARRVKIEATVPESTAATLAAGDAVEVEAGGARRAGTIAEILPGADARSRTVTVRVVLDNAEGALRVGTFARVAFGAPGRAALAVPEGALLRRGPLAGVFVVDDGGVARLRWLSVGAVRDGRVEVLAGLVAGERYVVAPPAGMQDGSRVTAEAESPR
jgi:RND family efflux transporter MFP subunit